MLGSLTIAALWAGVLYHLSEEKAQAESAAIQNTSNLARAFGEHILRTIRAVDQTLLYVRASYARDPAHFDMSLWSENSEFLAGLTFQVSIIDRAGFLVASNRAPVTRHLDLSDREHFRVHAQTTRDELFISQPLFGRVSGQWSVQLTRRISAADGSFNGVVVVSLDTYQLSRFYESVDLGTGGAVTLLGFDGIVRARATRTDTASGQALPESGVLQAHAAHRSGSFTSVSLIDGVRRISSFREATGFPLLVVVGLAESEVLATYRQNRATYLAAAALLSGLLLVVMALMVRHQARLQRTRERLRASEVTYRSLVENLAEVVFRTDTQGRWTFLNPAYAGLTGFSVAETVGRSPLEHMHPDDHQLNQERFWRLISGQEDHCRHELRYVTRSGAIRWLEVAAHVMVEGGNITGTHGTLRDITERHDAAEALRASEGRLAQKSELLELTLEHMSQGIMMVDGERRVQVCNHRAADLLALPESLRTRRPSFDEILRWQWQAGEFGDAADGSFEAWLHHFVLSGGIADIEQTYERRRPNGTVLEIRSIPTPNGGVVRTYTDITQQKSAEEALRAARDEAAGAARAKSDFLAMMSHEIRSPMSGVLGIIELLRQTPLQDEQQRMVELVHGSASTLMRVLNDVLDFSKVEAGAMVVAAEPSVLLPLVASVVEPLTLAADKKGLALESDIARDLPEAIMVDPLRLKQILVNLVGNAIKFTASGAVRLAIRRETHAAGAPMLNFAVSDTGIGVDAPALARLFEPFTQADASTTRNFGGTGLGLTISRRLARLLGGDLAAVSAPGQGSTFTLTLPLVEAYLPAKADTAGEVETAAGAADRFSEARILIAEDQLTNRWLLRRQLERLGFAVDAVEDGRAALSALGQDSYDLLITDCHMPGMEGTELASRIRDGERRDPAGRHLPILGLTADVTAEMLERCRTAGMDHVEMKPITLPRLEAALQRLLLRQSFDQAPAMTEDAAKPIFDSATYEELFAGSDVDGREWLEGYLSAASGLIDALRRAVAARAAADVAATAHQLAGATLSVGATRAGLLCRALEGAAKTPDWPRLSALAGEVTNALGEACREIDRFADSKGALVP